MALPNIEKIQLIKNLQQLAEGFLFEP